jgi:hypothetical protein
MCYIPGKWPCCLGRILSMTEAAMIQHQSASIIPQDDLLGGATTLPLNRNSSLKKKEIQMPIFNSLFLYFVISWTTLSLPWDMMSNAFHTNYVLHHLFPESYSYNAGSSSILYLCLLVTLLFSLLIDCVQNNTGAVVDQYLRNFGT